MSDSYFGRQQYVIYCSQVRATPSADCKISHIAVGRSNYLIHKTYQETTIFLVLLRIEQGFPFQRKLKSMKGKQADTILVGSGQGERQGREQLGGPGACTPGKF